MITVTNSKTLIEINTTFSAHLRDIRQTGCEVMSVLVSQEADVLLANLAYGHDKPYIQSLVQNKRAVSYHPPSDFFREKVVSV